MIGMVQKHRNYKNNVVKKKMEEERFIHTRVQKSIRGNLRISADGFPRMDFCLLQNIFCLFIFILLLLSSIIQQFSLAQVR